MKTSIAMDEIRKIRDENSLRHLNMSDEEISNEYAETMKWFTEKLGRPLEYVKIVKG